MDKSTFTFFWFKTPYTLVCGCQSSEKFATSISRVEVGFTLKIEAIYSSETLVIIYQATLVWYMVQKTAVWIRCSLNRNLAQYEHTRTLLRATPQLTGGYIIDL